MDLLVSISIGLRNDCGSSGNHEYSMVREGLGVEGVTTM